VYAHEQEYEAGYNKCLAGTKTLQPIIKIEGAVGPEGTVEDAIQLIWNDFYTNSLIGSGQQASGGVLDASVWAYAWYFSSVKWQFGRPRRAGESGRSGC